MITHATALLEEFAAELRALCNADGLAVLLQLEPVARDGVLLASCGRDPVPEFATADAAWSFLAAHLAARGGTAQNADAGLRQFASRDDRCALFCLPLSAPAILPAETTGGGAERRERPHVRNAPSLEGNLWIGVRGRASRSRLAALFEGNRTATPEGASNLGSFVNLSARLAWQVYQLSCSLGDPVTRLAGRMEFEIFLARAIAAAQSDAGCLGVLLINPDDFVMVNHRFGRDAGDRVLREIGVRLRGSVRQTDGLFRYGGAAFGVVLPGSDMASSRAVAEKFRRGLVERPYLEEGFELSFTIGGAVADAPALDQGGLTAADLLHRADAALNRAKLSGNTLVLSAMAESAEGLNHFDPLDGIFTTDVEKDYRNMLLLWETVALVSSVPEPAAMAADFVDRLGSRFRPDRMALVRLEEGGVAVLASSVRDDTAEKGRAGGRQIRFDDEQRSLIARALESGRLERARQGDADSPFGSVSYAVPLFAGTKAVGCLYLEGGNRRLHLDSSDLMFLTALVDQLAIALDRAELAADWVRRKDRESRELRQTVRDLRLVLQSSRLVYESPQMHALMDTIKRVAPSDATVLIIGESGTGKEMLAQSVHELSQRREAPFITVDCGAIADSLIETELFGHVKGAYTGADSASEGRVAQADGGTLFLDEIGELRLDVQAKLLRFVQEREFTPVGGTRTRQVNVRIVAATNRELADEVANGRFRQDLYYRLQVVSLQAVPLRERPDDILPLARFFLEKFRKQYDSRCASLSAGAERRLLAHDWPGNVRELQNCMLRAVLMCDAATLAAEDLALLPEHRAAGPAESAAVAPHIEPERPVVEERDLWQRLRKYLTEQVDAALGHGSSHPLPLGRWLQTDLVLACAAAHADVTRRAARVVGAPESTFRRQLNRARAEEAAGMAGRSAAWACMPPLLEALARSEDLAEEGELLASARAVLLEIVHERVDGNSRLGAALMGVTPPTFKRWVSRHVA